jgi:hypothetical protein
LRPSQVALLQKGDALLVDPPRHARVHPTATTTSLTIVLVIGTRAVLLATTRTGEEETIIAATTGDMTLGTTNLIGRTMTTEETMTVTATATATVHATMTMAATATDAATVETETEIVTAAATMKNGIMTVGVINATIVTVDATAHRADVQGVGDATTDRGHPDVVHVGFPQTPSIRSPRLSVPNPFFL